MSNTQIISIGYFVALMIAASLNYIPGLTDEAGLAFGIFALDIYDDSLHVASAIWALVAGLMSVLVALTHRLCGNHVPWRCCTRSIRLAAARSISPRGDTNPHDLS